MTSSPDYARIDWWVRRARRGDPEAFRELLQSHAGAITATLVACGIHDPATAEDLAQDVALRAWQRLSSLQNPRAFPAWLRRIAANAARDSVRARRPPETELTEVGQIAGGPQPDEQLGRRTELQGRLAAFHRLDKESKILLLAAAEGRPTKEVAAELGLSPDAVRMRLMRARRRLRSDLEGQGESRDGLE